MQSESTIKDPGHPEAVEPLWSRYATSRSIEDRNRLVLFYAPLVRLVANRFASRMRSFQSVEELCSCGQLGLINAIERFDASEGYRFSTYATIRIQGAITDELRRDDILPKRMRARVRTYQLARESLEATLRRTPTLPEIAEHLGNSVGEIMEIDDMAVLSSYFVPLSMIGDAQCGSSALGPSEASDLESMRSILKDALRRVTERQRQVLILHYLEGFQKSEVAETLGIDRSRVTQLIQQGLRNLRIQLDSAKDLQP